MWFTRKLLEIFLRHHHEPANPLIFLPKTIFTNVIFNILLLLVFACVKISCFQKKWDENAKFLSFTFGGPILITYLYIVLNRSAINVYWMSSCFEMLPIVVFYFITPKKPLDITKKVFMFYFGLVFAILFVAHLCENFMEYKQTNEFKSKMESIMRENDVNCLTGLHSKPLGVALFSKAEGLPSVYLFIEDKRVFPLRDLSTAECNQKCIKITDSHYNFQ